MSENLNPPKPSILTINGGSSSIKFAIYPVERDRAATAVGSLDRIGLAGTTWKFTDLANDISENCTIGSLNYPAAIAYLAQRLRALPSDRQLAGIGHRVVHGLRYSEPELVNPALIAELRRIIPCDREHLPYAIALMESLGEQYPGLIQVACFDTAFHRTMPTVAKRLPIPRRFHAQAIERYGFHGLSYAYLMDQLQRIGDATAKRGKIILAHLGNGASMAAVLDGNCIDTTMGFTPTAGLVMSTRTGDLDPGLMGFMVSELGMTLEQFQHMVSFESGLLGISETSSDVQDLLAKEQTDPRAAEAIETFCYQSAKWIGSLSAALQGLDMLVFAGGIGEHSAEIRARICSRLGYLGLQIDPSNNGRSAEIISATESTIVVRVMRTDEQQMIARIVRSKLNTT